MGDYFRSTLQFRILKVHTNVKLIDRSGAKMIFSWKRVHSMEKGVVDGVMQVYKRCSLVSKSFMNRSATSHLRILAQINIEDASKSAVDLKIKINPYN